MGKLNVFLFLFFGVSKMFLNFTPQLFDTEQKCISLSRIKLNGAFLKLGARNPNEAEIELLMRRKEFLDEIHQVEGNKNGTLFRVDHCLCTVFSFSLFCQGVRGRFQKKTTYITIDFHNIMCRRFKTELDGQDGIISPNPKRPL